MKRLTLIVPAYNEELCIKDFYNTLEKYLKDLKISSRYLFVDDGSKDNTLDEIKALRKKDKRVQYISFSKNQGKEAALLSGLTEAKDDDYVVMMDADLQHPPYLIPLMLEKMNEGYDVVYGKKANRKGDKASNSFFAKSFYKTFDKYADVEMEKNATDYMLINNKVIKAFLSMPDEYRFTKGIMSYVGFKKCFIEFDFVKREKGKTKWNFKKLLKYGVNGLNQFSNIFIIVPIISFILSMLVSISSVVLFVFKILTLESFLILLLIPLLFAALSVVLYFLLFVLYSVRREVIKRPLYFIREMEVDEESSSLDKE